MIKKQAYVFLCVLLCVAMIFVDIKPLMEPEELPINCADFAWNPINTPLVFTTLSPEQAKAKTYFHKQQMKRQIVSMDTNIEILLQTRRWSSKQRRILQSCLSPMAVDVRLESNTHKKYGNIRLSNGR